MGMISAGLLMYKVNPELKVFLVHHGGPYWKNKDLLSWSIPKGLVNDGKDNHLLETAEREFYEETGVKPPIDKSKYIDLGNVKQKSGKVVHAW
ncbi:MAG: NUDIX domain-containing protein, partial [Candidatus Nanoarchaeia archaeon]